MTAYQIRPATEGDLDAVVQLLRPAMEAQEVLPRSRAEIGELLACGFVAEAESRVVGFATVEVYSVKLAELQCLVVDPAMRARGIGKALVRACIAKARELGVRELMAITASEPLFRQCGFRYALPGQKKALFIHPADAGEREDSGG